jgi:hypothetical protein
VTLVDLLYEVHTLTPGAVKLCVSAQVPPHEVFLPLLGAAGEAGMAAGMAAPAGGLAAIQLGTCKAACASAGAVRWLSAGPAPHSVVAPAADVCAAACVFASVQPSKVSTLI